MLRTSASGTLCVGGGAGWRQIGGAAGGRLGGGRTGVSVGRELAPAVTLCKIRPCSVGHVVTASPLPFCRFATFPLTKSAKTNRDTNIVGTALAAVRFRAQNPSVTATPCHLPFTREALQFAPTVCAPQLGNETTHRLRFVKASAVCCLYFFVVYCMQSKAFVLFGFQNSRNAFSYKIPKDISVQKQKIQKSL